MIHHATPLERSAVHSDAARWNARYCARQPRFEATPELTHCASYLPSAGHALELACGLGGNAMWLAMRDWSVLGLDVSIEALRLARGECQRRKLCIDWVVADAMAPPFPRRQFDLVLVTRFLDRRLWPWIRAATKPGGMVFYCTFNVRHLHRHPDFRRDFVLEHGELNAAFAEFDKLDGNDAIDNPCVVSWLLARRPPH